MPGRSFASTASYRYGFNGKENDKETVGTGDGTQDYGARIYNPALGRFFSVDPITRAYPELTPYQFASNMPILAIDLDGLEAFPNNAIQGKNGEIFVRTKLQPLADYEVFEQVTVQKADATSKFNSRVDFLVKSKATGNVYQIDVKTGNAQSSPNQTGVANTVTNDEYVEMRSNPKTKANGGFAKGSKLKLGGSVVLRVSPDNSTSTVEDLKINPNVQGSKEIKALVDKVNNDINSNNKKNNDKNDNNNKGNDEYDGDPIIVPTEMPLAPVEVPVVEPFFEPIPFIP